jgi:hypothetical protein
VLPGTDLVSNPLKTMRFSTADNAARARTTNNLRKPGVNQEL